MAYYNNRKILQANIASTPQVQDVVVKRIWLSQDAPFFASNKIAGNFDEDETNIFNDAAHMFINFETTPIDKKIIREIKRGRFVIRFDYPVRYKNRGARGGWAEPGYTPVVESEHTRYDVNLITNVEKGEKPNGCGIRSFTPNFVSTHHKDFYINSLVFVEEEDIKTNRYGEKYIHKKMGLLDLLNKFWEVLKQNDKYISPFTYLTSDARSELLNNWKNIYVGGIPQITPKSGYQEDGWADLAGSTEADSKLSANNNIFINR